MKFYSLSFIALIMLLSISFCSALRKGDNVLFKLFNVSGFSFPSFLSFVASENLILVVGAFIITAIKESPSLVADADKLYKAIEVEPVFKPVAP